MLNMKEDYMEILNDIISIVISTITSLIHSFLPFSLLWLVLMEKTTSEPLVRVGVKKERFA